MWWIEAIQMQAFSQCPQRTLFSWLYFEDEPHLTLSRKMLKSTKWLQIRGNMIMIKEVCYLLKVSINQKYVSKYLRSYLYVLRSKTIGACSLRINLEVKKKNQASGERMSVYMHSMMRTIRSTFDSIQKTITVWKFILYIIINYQTADLITWLTLISI